MFLGWEPHPMNANFDLTYLSGGDEWFGPNYGGATVYTNVRAGYLEECPNVGQLLKNLKFTLEMENEIMGAILDDGTGARGCRERLAQGASGGARGLAGGRHHLRGRARPARGQGASGHLLSGHEHGRGTPHPVLPAPRMRLAVPAPRASVIVASDCGRRCQILAAGHACCRLRSAASVSPIRRLRPDPA